MKTVSYTHLALRTGFRDGISYDDLYQRLLFGAGGSAADEYLLLADFQSYCDAESRMVETYLDQRRWNQMSLHNIARSGIFAADRAVAEYAEHIWHVPVSYTHLKLWFYRHHLWSL